MRLQTIITSFSLSLCDIYSFYGLIIREYPNQNHPKFNIHRADFHKSQFLWRLQPNSKRNRGKRDGKPSLVTTGEKQRLSDPRRDLSMSRQGGRMTWRKCREAVTSPPLPPEAEEGQVVVGMSGCHRVPVGQVQVGRGPAWPHQVLIRSMLCSYLPASLQGYGEHPPGAGTPLSGTACI